MDGNKISIIDGLTSSEALHILIQHFMGDKYYTINCGVNQSNAEAVRDILNRYPSGKIRRIHKSNET